MLDLAINPFFHASIVEKERDEEQQVEDDPNNLED